MILCKEREEIFCRERIGGFLQRKRGDFPQRKRRGVSAMKENRGGGLLCLVLYYC